MKNIKSCGSIKTFIFWVLIETQREKERMKIKREKDRERDKDEIRDCKKDKKDFF